MRVHQHFYGVDSPSPGRFIRQVRFTPPSLKTLWRFSKATGTLRTGLLFGKRVDDQLEIYHITPRCSPDLLQPGVNALDPGYVLGASEAVQTLLGEEMEWVGNWLMPADRLPDPTRLQHTLEAAGRAGLMSMHHVLVYCTQPWHLMDAEAYLWLDGGVKQIECETQRLILPPQP